MTAPFFSLQALDMAVAGVKQSPALYVPLIYGWLYLNMVVHELGHCGATLVQGGKMVGLRFGALTVLKLRGRIVRRWIFGVGIWGAHSVQADRPKLSVRKQWLVTVAGPAASAMMAALAAFAYLWAPGPLTWFMWLSSFVSALEGFFFPLNSDARKIWRGIRSFCR